MLVSEHVTSQRAIAEEPAEPDHCGELVASSCEAVCVASSAVETIGASVAGVLTSALGATTGVLVWDTSADENDAGLSSGPGSQRRDAFA